MKWIDYNGEPYPSQGPLSLHDYWSRELLTSLLLTNTSLKDRRLQLAGTDRQGSLITIVKL